MVLHQTLVSFSEHACMFLSRPPSFTFYFRSVGGWLVRWFAGQLRALLWLCRQPRWGNGLPRLSLPSLRGVSIFFPNLFALYSSWFCVGPGLSGVAAGCGAWTVPESRSQSALALWTVSGLLWIPLNLGWTCVFLAASAACDFHLQTLKEPVPWALDQWFLISWGFSI